MRKKCEKMRKSGPRPPQKMSNKVIPDLRIFQVASKRHPSCAQEVQEAPKTPQDAPRASQERANSGQERPQTTQERPKSCQERPQSDRNLPEGRPMCQQRHVFCAFLCFLLFCSIFDFFLGVCCIFLWLLSFFRKFAS